jgi:hypothetical protein
MNKRHHHRLAKLPRRIASPGLLLLICALLAIVLSHTHQPSASPEVSFTDTSLGGLSIVPASCPSAPPATTADSGGYQLNPGDTGREINIYTHDFCITNQNGQAYFIPVHTPAELDAFHNAIPGLSGVIKTFPDSYHP